MAKPAESTPARRIFVGYAANDARPVAEQLRAALDAAGLETLGDWTLRPGEKWSDALDAMLSRADGAVIVITPGALRSQALSREARVFQQRVSQEPDFVVVPLPVDGITVDDVAGSPLAWVADFQWPNGPSTQARVAAAVASLTRAGAPFATPPASAAGSSAESSSGPAGSATATPQPAPAEPPEMSGSTRDVVSYASSRAGNGPVDASVVLVSALRYARDTSLPGVTSALLAALAGRQHDDEELLDRLDAVVGVSGRPAAEDRPAAELTAPPLSRLLALAADFAQGVSGHRRIHLRHLVAATVLADDPPLRPELLAELGVTAAELRQQVREAAQQETSGEPLQQWEALLPAGPRRLAGGISTDRVDPNRGIPLSQDDLGFGVWASMFAHIIASESTPMPLSIGLFGAWGSGKSYFMGLLRSAIAGFTAAGPPYLSRVAQIGFNAWHYADTNIWASLGDEIFRQLVGPSETAEESRQKLREQLAEGQAERRQLQARTAQAKAETARLEAELREATAERQLRAGDLLTAVRESAELRKQLNQVWRRLGISDESEQAEILADEIRGLPQNDRVLRSLPGQRRTWLMAAICLIALLITVAGIWIPASWGARLRDGGAASTITLVLAFGVILLGSVKTGLNRLSALAADLTQGATSAAQRRTREKVNDKLAQLKQAEADENITSAQLAQVTARVGELARELADLMPGQRLYTFLAERSASGTYTSQLGLVSTIRKDFEHLVKLLDDWRDKGGDDQEHPGIDRIVLYIDDLDRCGPRQVVQVLQAVHLLLALDLFVVVVGVDPRWLTRSLRHEFPSTLDSKPQDHLEERDLTEAMPADYLEKIFNIPFALPAMPKDGLDRLISRLAATPAADPDPDRATPAGPQPASQAAPETSAQVQSHSEIDRVLGRVTDEEARPITAEELSFLAKLDLFVSTPRDAKRMFNLYRMLRSSRDTSAASAFVGGNGQPGEYQAVAMLLAMLTTDAHLLRYVLDAPPQFGPSPQQKILVAGGLTRRPPQDHWTSFVGDLRPERTEDRWENQVIGLIPDREVRGWQRLAEAAANTSGQISLPDLSVFQRWAPSVRRFSYLLSPLNDPSAADPRDGHPQANG
jgi:KAP family P-loop domain/TIR domain